MHRLRLGVNIDHVATLRNARGGRDPDPVRAALLAQSAGADGITAHLREDRRHIRDADIPAIMAAIRIPLNFEMAATEEMRDLAVAYCPHAVCLVPERREERTTEGGLDVAGSNVLADMVPVLARSSRVSLFIAADPAQVEASASVGAQVVELHTGAFCDAVADGHEAEAAEELERLRAAAAQAHGLGLEVHLGHGIAFDSVAPLAAIPEAVELNIGHFLMGEALFVGLPAALAEMRRRMDDARRAA
ncbi:pyridoxine 5'-phosphate synthase [Jannaschia sp. Os4]|uniref:pyridoxine 5'-phosphate synthase n=1 Tax=Jannaschia sp. Os4 TaxID=2807617 RepID=UPI0019399022|nr:pyridoxine 5'-phosphate synthase [Jannaschia sp. Os4]MBM2577201.1 pyridoxine 5'-phosphate synthase [Jannaschia sp. Os4]